MSRLQCLYFCSIYQTSFTMSWLGPDTRWVEGTDNFYMLFLQCKFAWAFSMAANEKWCLFTEVNALLVHS
ncbi:hypothetical protein KUCAC02_029300 [Chaenocephalus aceratus]|uniref:Uncharacterized protein n=1 Tax=Chaenocephalus aceratus TaxID=36190 RepID=A0ACB9X6A9_CHAAC|nr:hypothetical protein KUCAC02_029300 [Chaenocephalus aceratus]